MAPEELGEGVGSVMLKDETRCIRCGLCAARCPANTITMESYNLLPAEPTGLISIEAIDARLRAQPAAQRDNEIDYGRRRQVQVQGPANAGIDRREFFVRIGLGSMGIAAAGTAVFGYQFLSPNVLYEPSPIVNMGKPESYQPDSVTLDVGCANLCDSCAGRILRVERGLHAPRLPDGVEAGPRDHRLPVPWQQVRRLSAGGQKAGRKNRGSRAKAAAVAENVAQR